MLLNLKPGAIIDVVATSYPYFDTTAQQVTDFISSLGYQARISEDFQEKGADPFSANTDKIRAKIFDNDELVYELINKHSLQKTPSSDDKLTAEYELCKGPAYKTITDNITESSKNDPINKSTCQSINDIQSNQGLTSDQNKSLQGLPGDILNIQGLPNGFDNKHKNVTNL